MSKMNYHISDSINRKKNLDYIVNSLVEAFRKLSGKFIIEKTVERAILKIDFPVEYGEIFYQILSDKIADVIAVNYKYEYLTKYVRTTGVSDIDYEMLIASIISADLDDDRRYVLDGKLSLEDFSIDGYFNFRLRPLKEKWREIVTYIPTYFTRDKLFDFISYIICEKRGKRGIIYDGKVYDGRYNRMLKNTLVNDIKEGSVAREVILSGFSEVQLNSEITKTDETYLAKFFGDKIFFKNEKIT